jgi:hypothetical protein
MDEAGGEGGINGGISGDQNGNARVSVDAAVDDLRAYLDKAERLGARVVMPVTEVSGEAGAGVSPSSRTPAWGASQDYAPLRLAPVLAHATIEQNHIQPRVWSGSCPIFPLAPSPSSSPISKAAPNTTREIAQLRRERPPHESPDTDLFTNPRMN